MPITVVTPFKRIENLPFLIKALKDKCHWIVLQADDESIIEFPEWVEVRRYNVTNKKYISNRLFNEFIANGLDSETQYMILNDDDSVEEGFFDKIPDADVVITGMKRNDVDAPHVVWDVWPTLSHVEHGQDILLPVYGNMKIARVGGEQCIVKGKILRCFRYGLSPVGDGKMVCQIYHEYGAVFVPDAFVLFNYFEDGRFRSFRRKPQALFIGDSYCAANPHMGVSEWETNIWKSLESTNLADVARIHFDKYYYHFGKRADESVIKWVEEHKPDFIVLVLYKPLGSDPTVPEKATLEKLASLTKIITIWGDLEADEQVTLAREVEPYCVKMYATASKEVVDALGEKYVYTHVPKDPRVFNNPNKERDIDVVFSGSYGNGREERQEVLKYLLDNGINLVYGGSEGGDHFTTEEYADRYKRAKMTISFARARGKDVVNARVFEAMLCGTLVLNQESAEMTKLYTRGVQFIAWKDKEDLLSKVKLYLDNPTHRQLIALNGQIITEDYFSAKTFWDKILENL